MYMVLQPVRNYPGTFAQSFTDRKHVVAEALEQGAKVYKLDSLPQVIEIISEENIIEGKHE